MPTLNGLPDDLQLWKVGGQSYWVTAVPGTEPPVYLTWTVEDSDVQAAFGVGIDVVYNQTISQQEFDDIGGLVVGEHDDIAEYRENPYHILEDQFERMSEIQPWLQDPEVLALLAEAMYEGLDSDWLAETITTTTWWRTHTEGERAWAELYLKDPLTAEQRLKSNSIVIDSYMQQSGINNAPLELIEAIAHKVTTGTWTEAMWQSQIRALADPYSGIAIDDSLKSILGGVTLDTTRGGEQTVTDTVLKWLGPTHGAWDAGQIAEWAGKIRNDPDAEIELRDFLSNQRMALFPEYANANLTYDDIAAPWRNYVTNMWGQKVDETDPLFAKLVRTNDAAINGQILRREGLSRGIGQVVNDAKLGFASTFGQVRRPV